MLVMCCSLLLLPARDECDIGLFLPCFASPLSKCVHLQDSWVASDVLKIDEARWEANCGT